MTEIALVTGGTSGIGKGQVERWTAEGYKVVFCGRNEETGSAIAKKFNADFIKCDVTKENEVIEMFNKIENNHGKLDVLFNNAGGAQNCGTLDECKLENFQDTLNLNVTGSWLTMKYAIKLMKKNKTGGRIVNMSSVNAASAIGRFSGTGIGSCIVSLRN